MVLDGEAIRKVRSGREEGKRTIRLSGTSGVAIS